MIPIGLHAYFAFKIKRFLPKKDYYFLFFLVGSIIPEIDKIISIFISLLFQDNINIYIYNNMFTHSIIIMSIIYLFILIIFEIIKNDYFLQVSRAIILGIIFHISVDIVFNLKPINVFWPLPIGSINLMNINLSSKFEFILLGFEFLFFRLIASLLIKTILEHKNQDKYFIKTLSLWMKYEGYIFIIFMLSIFIIPKYILEIFSIFYIFSYMMLLFSIFKLKKTLI